MFLSSLSPIKIPSKKLSDRSFSLMKSPALSRLLDRSFAFSLAVALSISLLVTVSVIAVLGTETFQFFKWVSLPDFLLGREWAPLLEPKSFGVLPLVCGTTLIVLGAIVLALPLGLLVSIYLSEFCPWHLKSIIKPFLEILAGIPTIVYGFFALTFLTPILTHIIPSLQIFNALSAAIVVGIMIVPLISSLVDDAISSVPKSLRDGAYAMGATSFEVVTQILLPASIGRIGAAVILAISRAIGETMAVAVAAGAEPKMTLSFLESVQTMTAYIVQVSMGDTPQGGVEYLTCFAVGALLFVVTFILNSIGVAVVRKMDYYAH
jgi:phosphate transport system permease protein